MMIPVTGSDQFTHIQVKVTYSKGGLNYWNYKEEPRAIWLSVTPVQVQKHAGYETVSHTAGAGLRHLLEEVSRKSVAKLQKLAKQAEFEATHRSGITWELIRKVAEQKRLSVY
jgi:uncharacterized pyridoxal phosphate-containing UPF0001 family protein